MNKDCPLWMPKGSVRALMALGLIGAVIYFASAHGAGDVPAALTTLAGVVVTYYFKTREASE